MKAEQGFRVHMNPVLMITLHADAEPTPAEGGSAGWLSGACA